MNTFELLEALRSASRDSLHSIVLTIVFEDDPTLSGKIMNILDLKNPDDVRIHKEFMTCIMLLTVTNVDAHIRCKQPEVHDPEFMAECFRTNLDSFYKKAKIKTYVKEHKLTRKPLILN
jgi:hypothetical protein